MEGSLSIAFAGGSSAMGNIQSKALRMFQATKVNVEMKSMESKIDKAPNHLLHLTMMLSNALKMQENHDIILPKLEYFAVSESSKDIFRPATNTPALTDTFSLDFDANDSEWRHTAPEAALKQSVLSSDSSSTDTATSGVLKSAHGIVGMAGVRKTVALRGLAYDNDVRTRYMTLGQGANLRELSKPPGRNGGTDNCCNRERLNIST